MRQNQLQHHSVKKITRGEEDSNNNPVAFKVIFGKIQKNKSLVSLTKKDKM